jgi:molecular chaperone GrpE (heat shock protein)
VDLLGSDEFEKEKGNSDNLRRTMAQKDRLQLLWQQSEAEKKSLEEKLEKLKREVTTNTQLKERTALQEKQIEQTDKDVLALRRDIRQEQEARKSDKVHMIQEMLPMFNTTWLAGLHRSNDQLYTIIRKQMEEALGKLGVVLIEPLVGELFNPTKHHAIHSYEFAEGAPEVGTIRQVNKVGWSMNGVVVEAAEVAVGVEKKGGADESVLTA